MTDSRGRPVMLLSAIDAGRHDDVGSDVGLRTRRLSDRIETLREEGRADVETTPRGDPVREHERSAVYNPPHDRPDEDDHSRFHDECRYWESRSDFRLASAFDRRSVPDGGQRVEFPEVVLLVYENDAVRWNLRGVFPSVHEETGVPVTPEDYLSTLEEGGDWRPTESDLVRERHRSERERIRDRVADDPGLAGEGWRYYDSDVTVPSVDGRADLVLEREGSGEFLVVVVAPDPTDREAFDRAVGRLLRLRTGFERDVAPVGVSLGGVRMALAAPTFPDGYDWVREDLPVEFVRVTVD